MSEKEEPTQRAEQGYEIPVPKRKTWDKLLRKVANPKPPNGEPPRRKPPDSE